MGETGHRPWPLPAGPWIMAQTWHDLLFAHWPVPRASVEGLLPPGIMLDTFDGSAWVGVVPFRMSGIRLRGLPPLPGLSGFPEINVRTYVRVGNWPGVYFFSLDAASAIAVAAARRWFHLPYFRARMSAVTRAGQTRYGSRRIQRGAPPAEFRARYAPARDVALSPPGTLEHFLTERYCLYTVDARRRLCRAEIHHAPWPLQEAEADIELNTMAAASRIELPARAPALHFSKRLEVRVWPLARITALAADPRGHGPADPGSQLDK